MWRTELITLLQGWKCHHQNKHKSYTTGPIGDRIKSEHGIYPDNEQAPKKPLDAFIITTSKSFIGPVSVDKFRNKLIDRVISAQLPFTFFENGELRDLISMAHAASSPTTIKIPKADAMRTIMTKRYEMLKACISAVLQQQEKLSFTVDAWASQWSTDYLGVIAHCIDDE